MAKKPRDNDDSHSHEGGDGPTHQNEPNEHNSAFDPARELGRQLARGAAFAAGKQLYEGTAEKHVHALLEWIRSIT